MTSIKQLCAILIVLCCSSSVVAGEVLWFIYDGENRYHHSYVDESEVALRELLPAITINRASSGEIQINRRGHDKVLIVSVGSEGAQRAAQLGYPTLNTLVTRRTFEALRGNYQSPVSAVYLDQPVERYLHLVKLALPQREKMTVLVSDGMHPYVAEIKRSAASMGLALQTLLVEDEGTINKLFGTELLAEDTLLLLPDPSVVNRRTVKPLVLGSYRQGIPLVGYSKALVKAGALMAVHSSLTALEQKMYGAVKRYFSTGVLAAPRYLDDFEVSINYQLARALNLTLPSEAILKKRVREQLR